MIGCIVFLLANVSACHAFSQGSDVVAEPTPVKEQKEMSERFIEAIRNHDRVLERVSSSPGLPRDIDAIINTLMPNREN